MLKKQVLKKSNLRAVWDWLSILFNMKHQKSMPNKGVSNLAACMDFNFALQWRVCENLKKWKLAQGRARSLLYVSSLLCRIKF